LDGADDGQDAQNPDAMDVIDVRVDALVCSGALFEVVAYNRPGCGANTPAPYCQGPTDACLTRVCLCNGVTGGSGCGFSEEPFASWGACPDGDAPDAAPDSSM
jgi:hypothetical protein